MNLKNTLLGLSIPAILFITSCGKDYNSTGSSSNVTNPFHGSLTALIGSTNYSSEFFTVLDTTVNGYRQIVLSGLKYETDRTNNNYEAITITKTGYDGEKDYDISSTAQIVYTVVDSGVATTYNAVGGDGRILHLAISGTTYKGTFTAPFVHYDSNGNDTLWVSNGKFEMYK